MARLLRAGPELWSTLSAASARAEHKRVTRQSAARRGLADDDRPADVGSADGTSPQHWAGDHGHQHSERSSRRDDDALGGELRISRSVRRRARSEWPVLSASEGPRSSRLATLRSDQQHAEGAPLRSSTHTRDCASFVAQPFTVASVYLLLGECFRSRREPVSRAGASDRRPRLSRRLRRARCVAILVVAWRNTIGPRTRRRSRGTLRPAASRRSRLGPIVEHPVRPRTVGPHRTRPPQSSLG